MSSGTARMYKRKQQVPVTVPAPLASNEMPRTLTLAIVLSVIACGSGDGTTNGPDEPEPGSVAGVYQTRVTLTSTTCGPVTVEDNPTTVTHVQSSGAITLSHAGTSYTGTLATGGSFTTTPRTVDIGDGFTYVIALAGQFGSRSFEADATVDRSGSGTPCQFVVHWAGTR